MCLTKAAEQRKESHARIAFMLASHNEDSVRFAVKVIPLQPRADGPTSRRTNDHNSRYVLEMRLKRAKPWSFQDLIVFRGNQKVRV